MPSDPTGRSGGGTTVSRRGLLQGSGGAAAGAALAENLLFGVQEAMARSRGPAVLGPGAVTVRLRVNGEERAVEIEPRTTLAEALRGPLGLTGTKVVCDRGSCSACEVWLDGVTVCSCQTLAIEAQGREITTIEGLAKDGVLHPVQAAFVEHDAQMCGFCTPGMVMSCAALLERTPAPSLEDVKTAVSGNLCRCGTYPKVFQATLAAAGARRT